MTTLRLNDKRAKRAIFFLWVMLVLDIIILGFDFYEYQLFQKVKIGIGYTDSEIAFNKLLQRIVGLVYLSFATISAVTFLQWFVRAYHNLHLKAKKLSYKKGWALGGWFIPVKNFVVPFKIMKELYGKTDELIYNEKENPKANSENTILNIWWALCLISIMIAIAFSILMQDTSLDGLLSLFLVGIAIDIVGVFSAHITITIIKNYSKKEKELHR